MREIAQLIETKNYQEAEKKLNELLANDKDNLSAKEWYGYLEMSKKNYVKSKQFLEEVLVAKPQNPTLLYNLGLVYENLGERDKATDFYIKCLNYDENHKKAKDKLDKINPKKDLYGILKYEWSPSKSSSNIYYLWAAIYALLPLVFLISLTLNYDIVSFFSGFLSLAIGLPRLISNFFAGFFLNKTKYQVFEGGIKIYNNGINRKLVQKYMYEIPAIELCCPFPLSFTNDGVIRLQFESHEIPDHQSFNTLIRPWSGKQFHCLFTNDTYEKMEEIRNYIDNQMANAKAGGLIYR